MSQSNQDINEIFKIFAEAARTVLKDVCENSKPAVVLEPKIDLASKTLITIPVTKQVYPSERIFQELKGLDEIKKYLDFMLNGGEFSKKLEELIIYYLGGWLPINHPDYRSYMFLSFLKTIVDEYKERFGCDFTEQNFKVLFDEMTKYIYAEDREVVVIALLVNFELKGAVEITIDKYRIRRPSEWEIKKLIDNPFIMMSLVFNKINILDSWLLEITTKDLRMDIVKLLPNIDEFIKVARLFKKGYVSGNKILMRYLRAPKIFFRMITPSIVIMPNYTPPLEVVTKYSLDSNEVDSLRQLWNLYNRVKSNLREELKRALEWFNKSYEESEIENRILDLAIAFVVMFKSEDYKYLAPILILDKRDETITKDLKELRTERNKIVHSGHSDLPSNKLEEIARKAEEIFRRSFRRFLELIDKNKEYEEILNDINNKNKTLPRY